MEGKNLHVLREHCTQIQLTCHKNVNRILELMVNHSSGSKDNSSICGHLSQYAKCCLVLEKLCDYINNCCCNQDAVSQHSLRELNMKCSKISKCCKGLMKVLEKKEHEYIRCGMMHELCSLNKVSHLSGVGSTRRTSKKTSRK